MVLKGSLLLAILSATNFLLFNEFTASFFVYFLFTENCIDSLGANKIGRALKENSSITDLNLSDTHIIHIYSVCLILVSQTRNRIKYDYTKEYKCMIFEALETNTTLKKLDLSGNQHSPFFPVLFY